MGKMNKRDFLKLFGLVSVSGLIKPLSSLGNSQNKREHIPSNGDIAEIYMRINGKEYAGGAILDSKKKKDRVDVIGMLGESAQRTANKIYGLVDEDGNELTEK